jgi:glutaminase
VASTISTGTLPGEDTVRALVEAAHAESLGVHTGLVATYIPQLAKADPDACAVSVVSVRGRSAEVGDIGERFSIQSVSKPFVLALACDALGADATRDRLGVNATGMPFNSVMAVELNEQRTMNPMVNAGAIAATSLLVDAGGGAEAGWALVRDGLSRFAGRDLVIDEEVYDCETRTNLRNHGIAHLLHSYGRVLGDPDVATDVYTRQCSLSVDTHDLAVMAATLANGAVNPITGQQALPADRVRDVLSVMHTCGMYDFAGEWAYSVGVPAKSGVSGGLLVVIPGKMGIGVFSPGLDRFGNSVRGTQVCQELSERLGLHLFATDAEDRLLNPMSTAPMSSTPSAG